MMANELTQEVVCSRSRTLVLRLVRIAAVDIFKPLAQRNRSQGATVPSPEPRRPVKEVVSLQDQSAFGVTPLDSIAQDIRHCVAPTGVNAVHAPTTLGKIENIAESYTSQLVGYRQQISLNVVRG